MMITAKLTRDGNKNEIKREITVDFHCPETLSGLIETFGEPVVISNAVDAIVISAQAFLRSQLAKEGEKRMSDNEVKAAFAAWKPGVRRAADPEKKKNDIKAFVSKLDPLARRAFLKELREMSTPAQ